LKQQIGLKTKQALRTQINEKFNDLNIADNNKKYPTSGLTVTGISRFYSIYILLIFSNT
jgi:hypothetical protein